MRRQNNSRQGAGTSQQPPVPRPALSLLWYTAHSTPPPGFLRVPTAMPKRHMTTARPRKLSTERSPSPATRSSSSGSSEAADANSAPAQQAQRLRRWQSVVFSALFVGYFLYTTGRRGVTAAQEEMKEELGFTMEDIGMFNSAFTTGCAA
jgi:hypothetical protein